MSEQPEVVDIIDVLAGYQDSDASGFSDYQLTALECAVDAGCSDAALGCLCRLAVDKRRGWREAAMTPSRGEA